MAGIYVHIPFCQSRCIYCGFYSTTMVHLQKDYVDALISELNMRRNYVNQQEIRTIYIGGGTPSILSSSELTRLCNALSEYAGEHVEEFTMECNPDDVTVELANTIRELGINRVSMGVQTFSDSRLSFLHRRHKAEDAKNAVEIFRDAGIDNISIDLMFGFPGETLDEWREDILHAVSLNVKHISAYSLMYEEGTPLFKLLEENRIHEIDEGLSKDMYEMLIDTLESHGFEQYEISNFARKGYRSRHNSNYWRSIPYIGIGSAAHSFNINSRQWNVSDIRLYMDSVKEKSSKYIEQIEHLTDEEKYNDLITTALRTKEGICINTLSPRYSEYILSSAKKNIENGNLLLEGDYLHLTRKGLYISDNVMVDLIM